MILLDYLQLLDLFFPVDPLCPITPLNSILQQMVELHDWIVYHLLPSLNVHFLSRPNYSKDILMSDVLQ